MFVLFRLATTCAVFMLVLAPFGVFATWWGPFLAFGAQILVGMAFAALVFGWSARLRDEAGFGVLFRLGIFPLFLFSGAFFPVDNLGDVGEWVGPADAAVARRQPVADVLRRRRRLADRGRSTSRSWSRCSWSAGSGRSRV